MKIVKFFVSKAFWISVIVALLLCVLGAFIALQWLDKTTNHDQRIEVPNITKLTSEQAINKLKESKLQMVVLDTLDFNKNIPPLSIVEQNPKAATFVKENRKIYVKINAAKYRNLMLPNLEDLTYRQALTMITSLGLRKGKVSYSPSIAKDVVLRVSQNGKELKQGDQVQKNSVIDFVLGDGRAPLSPEQLDIAPAIE